MIGTLNNWVSSVEKTVYNVVGLSTAKKTVKKKCRCRKKCRKC